MVATVVAAAFLLVTVSKLVGARQELLLVRSDLTTARNYLSQGDGDGAKSVLDRADGHHRAAASATSAFTVKLLRRVPQRPAVVRAGVRL